jgi:hypothetical protein
MLLTLTLTTGLIAMQTTSYRVPTYLQDISVQYTTAHGLPDAPVHALAIAGEDDIRGHAARRLPRVAAAARPLAEGRRPARNAPHPRRGGQRGGHRRAAAVSSGRRRADAHTARGGRGTHRAAGGGARRLLGADPRRAAACPRRQGRRTHARAPPTASLRWFHEDTRGRLYAYAEGELERRFYRWQGGEWQLVPIKDNRGRYYDDFWLCAISDPIGHLWIGGHGRV